MYQCILLSKKYWYQFVTLDLLVWVNTVMNKLAKLVRNILSIPEFLRGQEVEKVKQFLQVVLQWCTRQQQFRVEFILAEDAEKLQLEHRFVECRTVISHHIITGHRSAAL
jgi:hypothetical protein